MNRSTQLVQALATFYLTVLVSLVAWVLLPWVVGHDPVVITSGSMGPTIQAGDVVLLREASEAYEVGDVITFDDPNRPGELLTHRVADVGADGAFTTRGDANRQADATRVPPDAVLGSGRLLVPAVGLPAMWVTSSPGLFAVWAVITFVAVRVVLATRRGEDDAMRRWPRWNGRVTKRVAAALPALAVTCAAASGALLLQTRAGASFTDTATTSSTMGAGASFTYVGAVDSDAPTSHWRLGETSGTTATDRKGTATATYTGGVTLGAAGLVSDGNTAVSLDGTTGYVAVPNHTSINTGGPYSALTVEAWIRPDDVTARRVVYEQGGASRGLNLYVESGRVRFGAWNLVNDGTGTPWGYVEASSAISAATTYHVVGVFSQAADHVKLYVNGAPVATTTGVGPLHAHSGAIGIGAMNSGAYFAGGSGSGNGNYFDGVIDEVALYPTALSDRRVQRHWLMR